MIAPVTHVLPVTTIRRERLLPVVGRVVVRQGQKVTPSDVIAEANLVPEHFMLDIVQGLAMPPDEADRHIQRRPGERVSEGDVIAGPVGIARRVVRTPRSGNVILAGGGRVLIEVESPAFELRAGFPGEVISLISDRGAVIEGSGALVQGVWGNGHFDFGLMHVLARKPEDVLTADQLDVSLRGSVILAGYCGEVDVLQAATELPVRGLVLSSMAASLVPIASRMQYPVMVLEGFGLLPMNAPAYRLLSTSDRREVALNAVAYDPYQGSRPELIIPLPTSGPPQLPTDMVEFESDQRVRIVRAPYKSQVGTIVSFRPGLETFPSGIAAPAADVLLENGSNVVVPLVNLEVLQ